MLLLFTMPSCGRCKDIKAKLEYEDYEFREVDVMASKENVELAKKYDIRMAGIIIDDQTGKEVKL